MGRIILIGHVARVETEAGETRVVVETYNHKKEPQHHVAVVSGLVGAPDLRAGYRVYLEGLVSGRKISTEFLQVLSHA